jgi:hypothetical protein
MVMKAVCEGILMGTHLLWDIFSMEEHFAFDHMCTSSPRCQFQAGVLLRVQLWMAFLTKMNLWVEYS